MFSIKSYWVVGLYEGEQAKKVLAHADAGIGYFVVERGGNRTSPTVRAVFRLAVDGPVPSHLDVITDSRKIEQYENMYSARNGGRKIEPIVSTLGVRS